MLFLVQTCGIHKVAENMTIEMGLKLGAKWPADTQHLWAG